jgi:O-antigen/teichoic acid export membrane protein
MLALRTLIGGFENVGVVAFRKDLQFGREFRYQVLQRVLTILATVGFALWLGDYRALAAGILLGRALGVGLSYLVHPYRPRLCVDRIGELLSFSGWMLVVNIAQFFHDKGDEVVVGGLGNPAAMGAYNVAADVATAPTTEVVLPVARALFPVFARISGDRAAVRVAYLDLFATMCLICAAIGPGMALVADDFVLLALGPQWLRRCRWCACWRSPAHCMPSCTTASPCWGRSARRGCPPC